eukprot:94004_1
MSSRKNRISKKPKDQHKPKMPQNPYFIFMNERRHILRKQHPNKIMTDITKLVADEWKVLSDKSKYKKEAEKLKQKYNIEMEQYKKSEHFKAHQEKLSQWKANEKERQTSESSVHSSSHEGSNNKQLIECEKRTSIPQWICGRCTLHNLLRKPQCEVCQYSYYESGNTELKKEVIDLTNTNHNKQNGKVNTNNSINVNKEKKKENTNNNTNSNSIQQKETSVSTQQIQEDSFTTDNAQKTESLSHNDEINEIKKKIKPQLTNDNDKNMENNNNHNSELISNKKRFKCNWCDNKYESLSSRNTHSKYIHIDDPNYCGKPKCVYCHNEFSTHDNLKRHMNNVHHEQYKPSIPSPINIGVTPMGDDMDEISKSLTAQNNKGTDKYIPPAKCTVTSINLIPMTVPMATYVLSIISIISNIRQLSGGFESTHMENVPTYSKTIQWKLQRFNVIEKNIRENKYENIGVIFEDITDAWKKMYPLTQSEVHDLNGDLVTFVADIECQFYELWEEFKQLLIKQGYLKENISDNELSDEDEIMDSNNDNKETKRGIGEDVKYWLTNVVKLPQYCDTFISNGFDDMTFIIGTITMENLKAIGINKPNQEDHRRKILHCANSPDCKKRKNKQKLKYSSPIILHSGLSQHQKNDFGMFKQKFGDRATFTSEWKDNVTHLITPTTIDENELILSARTTKYFQSVISGSWILCFDWVKECLNKNVLIRENKYEVIADIHSKNGCKITRELRMRGKNDEGLFGDILCVIGYFEKDKIEKDITNILKIGGGIILQKFPYEWLKNIDKYKSEMNGKRMVFVYDKEHNVLNTKQKDFVEKFDVLSIGYKDVFDAISNYTSVVDFIGGEINNEIDEEPPQKRRKL